MPRRASLPERSFCETAGFIASRASRTRLPITFLCFDSRVFFTASASRRISAVKYSHEEYPWIPHDFTLDESEAPLRHSNQNQSNMKTHTANLILAVLTSLVVSQQSSAQSLSLGLVAHYELDGNGLDSSGNGANGTFVGTLTPIADRLGNPSGALGFDKNGYVDLPNTTLLNGATQAAITGWVRNRQLPGEDGFVISADDPRPGLAPFTVRFNGNEIQEAFFGDTLKGPTDPDRFVGFEGGSGILVPQNAWFSFVSQFSSLGGQTTYQLYLNGQLVLERDYARSAQVTFDQPMPIEIGALEGYFYPSTEFRGDIDDLRIYDRALTPEEIAVISAPEPTVAFLLAGAAFPVLLARRRSK